MNSYYPQTVTRLKVTAPQMFTSHHCSEKSLETTKFFSRAAYTSFRKFFSGAAMALQFVGISGTRKKAILNGYAYTRQRHSVGTRWSQWACDQKHQKCRGRLHIDQDEREWKEVGVHNHVADQGRTKAMLTKQNIKRRVANQPNANPARITQEELGRVDSETLLALPNEASMKKMAQRVRREELPALPLTLEDIEEIPERYKTLNGEDWLLYDSGAADDHRVIVFGLRSTIRALAASKAWFGDGTFKSSPRLVRQLYTIHYETHENVILGLTVFMRNRTRDSYKKLFDAIRNLLPENRRDDPRRFSVDFELAASQAFTEVFPEAVLGYCFFHFTQSLWRKAKESGVAAAYGRPENVELRNQFHAVMALAFVPTDHVPAAFDELQAVCTEELEEVLILLEHYYVLGKRRGRGRLPPRYPIPSWNVNNRTLEGEPRTNNSVEAWNRRFNSIVGKSHPNIFAVMEELRREELYAASQRTLVDLGTSPPRKKAKYISNDLRLQRLVERFNEIIQEDADDNNDEWHSGYLKFTRAVGHSARGVMDFLPPISDEENILTV